MESQSCHLCHGNSQIGSGGQGRNRTTDTRIFSTAESAARREQAEDRQSIFRRSTEPPCSTEPIPNRQPETVTEAPPDRSGSTVYEHLDRTFSEPGAKRGQHRVRPTYHASRCRRRRDRLRRHSVQRGGNLRILRTGELKAPPRTHRRPMCATVQSFVVFPTRLKSGLWVYGDSDESPSSRGRRAAHSQSGPERGRGRLLGGRAWHNLNGSHRISRSSASR